MRNLPPARVAAPKKTPPANGGEGIFLGDNLYWHPLRMPNLNSLILGTSGSGKTQTLKAIAHEMTGLFPQIKIIVLDFHGDLELPGESLYEINQNSQHGINPLVVDLDRAGGGPALQAIAVAATLRRSLVMGANQEGVLIEAFINCYQQRGIYQNNPDTWTKEPPNFEDLEDELLNRIEAGCKESTKIKLKLAASFQYGIFNKPQPPSSQGVTRFDLSALLKVPGLGAIAAESLIKQLMDLHRLLGANPGTLRTYIFVDEARLVKSSPSVAAVCRDGRKFGLGIALASQIPADFNDEVMANSSLKIVLPVDITEQKKTATKFKFGETVVASLNPLEALVRMGQAASKIKIKPYFERV